MARSERGTLKQRFSKGVHKARKKSRVWEITFEEWHSLIQDGCHYCRASLLFSSGYSLDRKNNARGYSLDNVLPCCGSCNRIRGDVLTVDETEELIWHLMAYRALHKAA